MKPKLIHSIKAYAYISLCAISITFFIYIVASFVAINSHNLTDQQYSENNFFIVMQEVFKGE